MILRLPVPPSANQMYVRGRHISKKYKDWKALVLASAKVHVPIEDPVSLHIKCPTNKRRDLDNHLKPLLDILTPLRMGKDKKQTRGGLGVIADDRWRYVREIHMEWHDDEEVEICVRKI